MIIIQQPGLIKDFITLKKTNGLSMGFVPTMGALHDGHIGLVNQSASECDITVCSIFVNPTQFNDSADYKKYPNRAENDIRLLERSGTDILFLPPVDAIYPDGTADLEIYNLGYAGEVLEGKYRPGHFQGVCQVMSRLLKAVKPDYLFMGQKDYQQSLIIKKLLEEPEFNTTLVISPIFRENDGLAMSSRNLRLTPEQRQKAPDIYKALVMAKDKLKPGKLQNLKLEAAKFLENKGFKVDYFEIAAAEDLKILEYWDGSLPLVILVAVFLGEVRLIDNILVNS